MKKAPEGRPKSKELGHFPHNLRQSNVGEDTLQHGEPNALDCALKPLGAQPAEMMTVDAERKLRRVG